MSVNKCFISCVSLFIKEICTLPQMYWLDQDDTAVSFKNVIALMTLKCEFPWVAVVTYNGGTAHPWVTIVINVWLFTTERNEGFSHRASTILVKNIKLPKKIVCYPRIKYLGVLWSTG